jgi:hypothetical protein
MLNTTNGPQNVDPNPHRHIATTRIYEEDMVYTDEDPEILSVMPAGDWRAVVEGEPVPLVAFVALDDGKLYGVVVGPRGRVDLTEDNAEDLAGFSGYRKVNELQKGN